MFKRLFSRFAATAALAAGIAALSVSDVPLLADNPPDASIAASSQTFVGDVKNAVDTARIGLVADQSSFVLYVCSQDEAFNKTSARWVRGIVTNGKFEGKSPDSALTVRGTIGMEAAEGTITVGGNEMTFAAKLPDERTFAGLYRCEEKDTTNDYIAGWVVDEDDAVAGAIQNRQNKQITNPPGVAAQQKPNPKGNVVSPRGGNRIPNLDVGQGTGVGGQQVTDPKKLDRTHTFSKAGTFTATVTVTDDDGSSSSQYQVTVADEISPPPPPPPLNTPPTISDLANQASNGSTIGPIAFTVGDAETAADGLVVTAQSNNTTLVNNVILGGSGANRTVTFTPVEGRFGTAILSLTVRDAQGAIATDTFTVTISPPPPATPRPILVGFPEFAAGADAGGGSATLFNPDKSVRFTVTPFAGFTGGVRTATADFNGDGVADLIVGTGPGIATRVVILDGKSQAVLFDVAPFEASFVGGVYVSAGDVTGDGIPDLAITPDEGGGPRVDVYSGAASFPKLIGFFGIDDVNFRGGARSAIADMTGDGVADLIVVAGFGGGPRVAGFDGKSLAGTPVKIFGDFFAFEQTLRNGIFVTAGDINGDGFADLIAGGGPGGGPRVLAFDGKSLRNNKYVNLANFFGGDVNSRGGIRVAAKDLDGDTKADLVVGSGAGAGSRVTGYLGKTITASGTPPAQFEFDSISGFNGGVFVG